jgi:nitrate/nitrite transport system permease protein
MVGIISSLVGAQRYQWIGGAPQIPLKPIAEAAISAAGAALVLAVIWQIAAALSKGDLPGPFPTLRVFWDMVSNPLYNNGPNDKGVGLQLAASLQRVFIGFSLGAAVAIPLGMLLGLSSWSRRLLDPITQILRPISPLAWFPMGLAAAHAVDTATLFVIFITSLWPTVVNTSFGVRSLPESHKNVARIFQFPRRKYLTTIVLPYSLPYIITGLRLSMGIAWLVIVAAEMLSGSSGIGWLVWDSWNALNLEKVISAVLLIGLVGFGLDRVFLFLVRRVSYEEAS